MDIRRYSAIISEDERLLVPGVRLMVKSVLSKSGFLMVQLEHVEDDFPCLIKDFAFNCF